MILTVTLNFAVDVTYHLERIRLRETSRVDPVARRAGGKGVNVARVLHALGHDAAVTGFAGGSTGAEARAELEAAGLTDLTVSIAEPSRTTLMVVEADGGATGFSEPGPRVSGEESPGLGPRRLKGEVRQQATPRDDCLVAKGTRRERPCRISKGIVVRRSGRTSSGSPPRTVPRSRRNPGSELEASLELADPVEEFAYEHGARVVEPEVQA
jgi:hypothetical protein